MVVERTVGAFALAGTLAVAAALPAVAQKPTLVDGSQVDAILQIAQERGPAYVDMQPNGDPRISGEIDGLTYHVSFGSCVANTNCRDLTFYAGFLDNKQTLDVINAWNRDRRFGKAYLDGDLDAVIEFDVNLEHGVTRENLDTTFHLWTLILDQYTTYIGYK